MATKKGNLLTKKVKFNNKDVTLYSIDGITWSTRADELQAIIDRHSNEQAGFSSDLKGEEREKEKPQPKHKKFAKVHNDDEIDEVIEDDIVPPEADEEIEADLIGDDDEVISDVEVDDDEVVEAKRSSKKPAMPSAISPSPKKEVSGKAQLQAASKKGCSLKMAPSKKKLPVKAKAPLKAEKKLKAKPAKPKKIVKLAKPKKKAA